MTQFIMLPWDACLIRRQDIKGVRVLKVGQSRFAVDVELFKYNGFETIHVQKNEGAYGDALNLFNQLVEEIMKVNFTVTIKDFKKEIMQIKNAYILLKNNPEPGTPESFEIAGGVEVFDLVLRLIEKYDEGEFES